MRTYAVRNHDGTTTEKTAAEIVGALSAKPSPSFRGRMTSLARAMLDELNRQDFDGATVRELVGKMQAILDRD